MFAGLLALIIDQDLTRKENMCSREGKTKSFKSLDVQLRQFVLVFCCDKTFDFQATGRIFVGLFQVGAWGYFDGANRLEERILSAVSHLIQSIKLGLGAISFDQSAEVEILGKMLWINTNRGIVITMNPGYAGRSNLPDNLKLFRSMAMTRPGFWTAETLSSKVVPFFSLCSKQLSRQPNYNFAGEIGGAIIASVDQREQCILIQSVTETIVSKLVAEHVHLLNR
ncbi:dynein heavy chain 1, cytosolic [Phakopsora pachyrhizi]|uniref:Dynein heavy chain 1, cytosolic n=1 Tax=Phakopsora pachyrhizi TaxID=170000 RepID=A0AAV0B858_PHAPC|nr:dynein heavy chain 1, cytosolic [Phakopsora pachyrhizi]